VGRLCAYSIADLADRVADDGHVRNVGRAYIGFVAVACFFIADKRAPDSTVISLAPGVGEQDGSSDPEIVWLHGGAP